MSARRPAGEAPTPIARPSAACRIRSAGERDLEPVRELYAQLAAHHGSAGPGFALRESRSEGLRQHLAARLRAPEARLLVAEPEARRGELLGFCLVALLRRPDFFQETERVAVEALFVLPAARRAGVARALVEAALAQLDPAGRHRVELSVARDNPPGRAFWRALGFQPVMDVLERRR